MVMLARFLLPLLAALASYFLLARRVRFGSTVWGKCAGLAQCLYFLIVLAQADHVGIARAVTFPFLIATLVLMLAAPAAQIKANAQREK